ncbi:hypothetical protein [Nesterenkonia alba]|uniref:hypothetical protein n=1 Tax=Nesterenkonia alba TaxID=515814 RepID=UPI0003B52359|nr:hypothetical protein [Nesterenkonia alba]
MRTRDFSACKAPQARAGAVFLGQNEYRTPKGFLQQLILWPPLARRLKQAPGYLWHLSYYRFPLRIGLVVAFETREQLYEFAKTDEHQAIMHWLVGTDENSGTWPADPDSAPVLGGFIRTYTADEVGYANGTWRADRDELRMIERWESQRSADRPPGNLPARLRAGIRGAGQVAALGRALTGSARDTLVRRR